MAIIQSQVRQVLGGLSRSANGVKRICSASVSVRPSTTAASYSQWHRQLPSSTELCTLKPPQCFCAHPRSSRTFSSSSATAATNNNIPLLPVVGCGSNVVDRFFRVRAIPKPGEKGFFASPTRILEDSIVGGVTLNHLAWAAQLKVPAGLMALQGDDASGALIRQAMCDLEVSANHVQVDPAYTTAESYVILQEDGERSIIMASGGTSEIDAEVVDRHFAAPARAASIVTTEISQVPLSGVLALLHAARAGGAVSVLDVDVQPSVAVDEARLGSMDEVLACARTADVLKPAKHAAEELLAELEPSLASEIAQMSALELAQELRNATDARLVALTSGGAGCALATASESVVVAPFALDRVVDATGAGDAFLGGLVAGLYQLLVTEGRDFASSNDEALPLRDLATLANATGAACCGTLGALPDSTGRDIVRGFLESTSAAARWNALTEDESPAVGVGSGNSSSNSSSSSSSSSNIAVDGDGDSAVLSFSHALARDLATAESLQSLDGKAIVDALEACNGTVFTTGIGKSACVARRMAVSLSSTGTPAHFVHATEWVHGDLGALRAGDAVVFFSHSGNTQECAQLLPLLKDRNVTSTCVVGASDSKLAKDCNAALVYGTVPSEPVGGAPTSSVVAMEMAVNAVVTELILRRGFTEVDFALNHPGGSLGAALGK